MKVVLDNNIFISGIFWDTSICSKIIDAWYKNKFTLVTSKDIITELVNVLQDFKIKMPEDLILAWQKMLVENSVLVEPSIKLDIVEDPNDNMLFEAAIEGKADYIVSKDKKVLNVNCENIKVLTPEEFLELEQTQKSGSVK